MSDSEGGLLRAMRVGIDTHRQHVVYMPASCPVCHSEGFRARSRLLVRAGGRSIEAVLHLIDERIVPPDAAGFSESAWRKLDLHEGAPVLIRHAPPLHSLAAVRRKLAGVPFQDSDLQAIVRDISGGRYADEHIAAFLAASAELSVDEVADLTQAMVDAGQQLHWPEGRIVDKHCVGGLPGNRTTPIVVAIGVAAGLCMPKTSSRAITSPAGTADTMATMTRVDLGLEEMQEVVRETGGCLAWGGSVDLSPTDDLMIRIERSLELDAPSQLVASILSKKKAAGSTHVVIDIPVGPTAKIQTEAQADSLGELLQAVAERIGLKLDIVVTDGSQPIGEGIGPALEAHDVLAVLHRDPEAPQDLRERALLIAGHALELGEASRPGEGRADAEVILDDGQALAAFEAICRAQGGLWTPGKADHTAAVYAPFGGKVASIDNQAIARVAKLAGAPDDPEAGVVLHVRLGGIVTVGQPLFTLHADHPGSLAYAMAYLEDIGRPVTLARL